MAGHIATRKSTFTSASTSRKRRTHQPSVRDSGRRVSVNTKPEKYPIMNKQKQAEQCVLYVRAPPSSLVTENCVNDCAQGDSPERCGTAVVLVSESRLYNIGESNQLYSFSCLRLEKVLPVLR